MADSWKIPEERIKGIMDGSEFIEMDCFDCCTVVIMKMPNGFVLVEKSGTIDPADYSPEIGRRICYERLMGKVWELEGYIQKNEWHRHRLAQAKAEHLKAREEHAGDTMEMPAVKES